MAAVSLGGRYNVTANHDYIDSAWDVWVSEWKSTEGDWYPKGHYRVVADGRFEAHVTALVEHGVALRVAEQIARDDRGEW